MLKEKLALAEQGEEFSSGEYSDCSYEEEHTDEEVFVPEEHAIASNEGSEVIDTSGKII